MIGSAPLTRLKWLGTAGLLVCSACSAETSSSSFQVIDSAGVRIAASSKPRLGHGAWRIDSVPIVDIGGDDSDTTLSITEIAGAILLADGGFVIADAGDRVIRFFDSRGVKQRTVGRKGAGPGEYEELYRLRLTGDSIAAFDSELQRVTLLSAAGDYGRAFTMTGASVGARVEGRWPDGSFLFTDASGVRSDMPIHALRDTVGALRVRSDGTFESKLGKWPGRETVAVTTPRFVSSIESPYGKRSTIRLCQQGFLVGTADAAQLDGYDSNGQLKSHIRWSAERATVAGDELDAWRGMYRDRLRGAPTEFVDAFGKAIDIVTFPSVRPAYRTFHVSADGSLWVERVAKWSTDPVPSTWDVFDANGEWLTSIALPVGEELLDVRDDRVLMSWEDEDGVPHVRINRIRRNGE
jgi:hypothetical protein